MNSRKAEYSAIYRSLRDGGFIESLRAGGAGLDRVRSYVESFDDSALAPRPGPAQYPDYPLFPGLRHRPFWNAADFPAANLLEQAAADIASECAALDAEDFLQYAPPSMTKRWSVRLFNYMGIDMESADTRCPATRALLDRLPGTCLDYPWGDALLSVHASESHLRPHCSVDNLRVRCHLALVIPPGCSIRVADQTRSWEAGKTLFFEDSFEHEVWNTSPHERAILIVDFWHPDLTPIERQALVAGFSRSAIRHRFLKQRLAAAEHVPARLDRYLDAQVEAQETLVDRQRYWPAARTAVAVS